MIRKTITSFASCDGTEALVLHRYFRKQFGSSSKMSHIRLSHGPGIPHLGVYPGKMDVKACT